MPRQCRRERPACLVLSQPATSSGGAVRYHRAPRGERACPRSRRLGPVSGRPSPSYATGGGPQSHEHRHRQPGALAASPSPLFDAGRSSARALSGDRGTSGAARRSSRASSSDVRATARVRRSRFARRLRRWRRADLPAAFTEDRADRGRGSRRRPSREAVLPPRPRREAGSRPRAPLNRSRGRSSSASCCRSGGGGALTMRRRTDRRGRGRRGRWSRGPRRSRPSRRRP